MSDIADHSWTRGGFPPDHADEYMALVRDRHDDNEDVDDKVVYQTVVGRFTPAKISRAQRCKSV